MSEDAIHDTRCKTPPQRSKSGKSDRTGGKWVVLFKCSSGLRAHITQKFN